MKMTAIFLCDLTGIMAEPWLKAGYDVILVDPQHDVFSETVYRGENETPSVRICYPLTVLDAVKKLQSVIASGSVCFVAGFPVCTDVAVSGTRHWESKRKADPYFQAKAALLAEQCRMIGELSGAPWFFENPVSAFSGIFGKPDYTFDPCEYGGYLPANDSHPIYPEYFPPQDAYKKKTCLWTGGGFIMPERRAVPPAESEGQGGSESHNRLGGKSDRTKNIRSATPRGFSQAAFEANAPHLRAANDNVPPPHPANDNTKA
ncbi:hypothetical protein [Bradyrhizobium sp.]|uniref:hypothetical protein n=1 Tax=Bradyrhizobium sp. TaxID=376 RepID=UPI0039E5B8A0